MDDQLFRMISHDIDALLDENQDAVVTLVPMEEEAPVTMKPHSFLPYKSLEVGAKEPLILGQYSKWSTVESDELNVQQQQQQQQQQQSMADQLAFSSPAAAYNLKVEMMHIILVNFWNAKMRQNMTMTKRMCSFCKKNGMSFVTYTSHSLRVNGVLQCPYLLRCQCNHCFKNGHTTSYCPMKERVTTASSGLAYPFIDRNLVNRYNNSSY